MKIFFSDSFLFPRAKSKGMERMKFLPALVMCCQTLTQVTEERGRQGTVHVPKGKGQ